MTTYSICNSAGKSFGTFEADSAAGACDAWARSLGYKSHDAMPGSPTGGNLIVTAVGLPAAPAASTCPFTLPLSVGTSVGRVPDQIFDARDQAVLILYGVDSRGAVDEARTMEWNQKGLERADYVVKAVNEHEGLVKRVAELEQQLHKAGGMLKTVSQCVSHECEDCREHAGLHHNAIEQLIAKPVDRRKD